MKHIQNVSRRKFLKGFGASSTALVLGVQFPGMSMLPKALAEPVEHTVFSPSVYLQIGSDNRVAVFVHRSEMGQGIRTSIPMIVADELEADWQQIDVIQALGDKKYGSQNTDGSKSIRRFYQPLREAGATARTMLEQAAAELWQVDVKDVEARSSMVVDKQRNKTVSFGELVARAAKLPVPEKSTLTFKSSSDFKFIGKSNVPLVDGKDIATGNTTFGYDVTLPNMAFAVIARPPVLAAKVVKIDDVAARKVSGVIDIIQLDDLVEPAVFKPLGGVAVIASNTWAAIKGREALNITWSESEHQSYDSASYKEMLQRSVEQPAQIFRTRGDVKATLAKAKNVKTASYYLPALTHAPMEPPAATAHFHDGQFDIWACTQTPQSAQGNVTNFMGVAPEQVNVNVTLLGGGFGRKSKPDFVIEAAVLAKKTARPIKVLWTREDEVKHGFYHAPCYQTLSASINDDKSVAAWRHIVAEPPIAATFSKGADVIGSEANLGLVDLPFDIKHIEIGAGKAPAHTRIGWLRSVNNINHAFGIGSFVDELAHAAQMDSKDYLISLLGKNAHIDPATDGAKYGNYGEKLSEFPIDTARLKAQVEQVAKMANWHQKREKGHGLGISVHRSFASYVACVVEVSANEQGKIKLEHIWMSVDCGLAVNPERVVSQMEGAAIFGVSLAFFGEITAKDGVIEQGNFDDYPMARIGDIPDISVEIAQNDAPPGGVGEPGVPPVAPAICNAIFAATGKRYRELPLNQYGIV